MPENSYGPIYKGYEFFKLFCGPIFLFNFLGTYFGVVVCLVGWFVCFGDCLWLCASVSFKWLFYDVNWSKPRGQLNRLDAVRFNSDNGNSRRRGLSSFHDETRFARADPVYALVCYLLLRHNRAVRRSHVYIALLDGAFGLSLPQWPTELIWPCNTNINIEVIRITLLCAISLFLLLIQLSWSSYKVGYTNSTNFTVFS